jgi:hypothetical protein
MRLLRRLFDRHQQADNTLAASYISATTPVKLAVAETLELLAANIQFREVCQKSDGDNAA